MLPFFLTTTRLAIALGIGLLTAPPAAAQRVPIVVNGAGGQISIGTGPAAVNLRTSMRQVSKKDFEQFDPILRLTSKRKDLKFDDAQQKQLAALAEPLKAMRDSLYKRVDSAQTPPARATPGFDPEEWKRGVDVVVTTTFLTLAEAYDKAAAQALAPLTGAQFVAATKVVDDLRAERDRSELIDRTR